MKKIVVIIFMLFSLAFIFACGEDKQDDNNDNGQNETVKEYTVKFIVDGEATEAKVAEGEKVSKPANPEKEGFEFVGWYAEDEAYDFEKEVTSDLELVAKFKKTKVEVKQYTVKFVADGDEITEVVIEGEKVSKPSDPVKDGYVFLGWFVGGEAYDFESSVTSDLELVAKFEEVHVHKYDEKVVEATCLEKGYTVFTCACGDTYKGNETPALNHDFGDWNIVKEATTEEEGLKVKECSRCDEKIEEIIPVIIDLTGTEYNIIFDLDGGFLGEYEDIEKLANQFLEDYNKYGKTNATKSNFLGDSTSSVKQSLSNKEMLEKWNWLFSYMYEDLSKYNKEIGTLSESYVKDALDLMPRLIECDTEVIKDSSKGPNFRTLVRSYIHGFLNCTKGSPDGNATFAKYVPDFGEEEVQNALLYAQYEEEVVMKHGDVLPIPIKKYYVFVGWMNDNGDYTKIINMEGFYSAMWAEANPVKEVKITNKIEELLLYDTYQLQWELLPSTIENTIVEITSSNANIVSVDKNGLLTAKKPGYAVIKVKSLSGEKKTDEFKLRVIKPGHFDISYVENSYVVENGVIQLNAKYIDSYGESLELIWKSLDENIATVENNGFIITHKAGVVDIRISLKDNEEIYQDIPVTILDIDTYTALEVFLEAHESNIYYEYKLPIGAGTPVYYADIIGSVSDILYNDELYIDTTYNKKTNDKYGADLESRRMESIEFITVHYTGNMNATANGKMHADYFSQPLSSVSTSIHYSTGNDGVFKGLDEEYRAAHAGDDGSLNTVSKFEWRDTDVVVLESDPLFPVVTITSNATFAINGRDTLIKVPEETKNGRGFVTDNKWLNEMGIAVNIKDGKYQLGTAWWCYTQIGEGRICSNGGNRNSIGIESAVNKGSDLWYTWQKTAQLVADIMVRHNLDITRVKGHHFFSAKDCPQPMLENELRLWWKFIELCQAEYNKLVNAKDYEVTFESSSSYVDNKGRVLKQGLTDEVISYTLTINDGKKTHTLELSSIIKGTYNN